MKWKSKALWLSLSIIVFITLLGLAVYFESAVYLYAASALPVVIVPLLPDMAKHRYADAAKNKNVRFAKLTIGGDPMLAISFSPGYIRWKRATGKLYFQWSQISGNPELDETPGQGHKEASLTVLPFDLSVHPRKQGWVGIDLGQLAQRAGTLPYTAGEVTRLLIRMSDLEAVVMPVAPQTGLPSGTGKQLQV
ncbi:hypothetical protein [Paenibacillus naphthalenovorans]|uniref:Uncharacterized protein n=1 Tax=Paenibacillus naphthalenovorans TaxID=162209 RepID=A0A0U2VX46_9BACL|nr:hypothetical protein [Paenibacillus naphthalenovorans]ALS24055.1 hypothetical protein IJ22_37170 [Paenibacillus naphthalenovorans]